MSGFFSGYWGDTGHDQTTFKQKFPEIEAGEAWPLRMVDYPEDGMLLADGGGYRIYCYGGNMTHCQGGYFPVNNGNSIYRDGINNVLYFDGHVEGVRGVDFWPWADNGYRDLHGKNDPMWIPFKFSFVGEPD